MPGITVYIVKAGDTLWDIAKKFYTKNVEDTRQLYMSSGTTYLEVISAQANLLNAQISKVTDDFYKMQAVVSLYSALGGGTK